MYEFKLAYYRLFECGLVPSHVSMSQSRPPIDIGNLAMDPSMYYTSMGGMDNLSASQAPSNINDTSMSGMLEESMLDDYDNMPMNFDSNNTNHNSQIPYSQMGSVIQRTDTELSDERENPPLNPNDVAMIGDVDGPGAGPLPTGFGAQSTLGNGSTLTEFTKRRNWSQRVVEELKDFLHILTPDGRIIYLSPSGEQLTEYSREELVGKFIVDFIHPDDSAIFVREFNESIASGNPLRFFYRFRKKNDQYTIFESHGHPHISSEAAQFGQATNTTGFCRGFFMMARPYPTKNAALLDSFLEHKIENERLMKKIEDLKREEAQEAIDAQMHWAKKQEGQSIPSEETDTMGSASTTQQPRSDLDAMAMPPPARPLSNAALTRQNLEDATAAARQDTINDKMARYEGLNATTLESIEMLTGLRYREGERSRGISTGDQSPALIKGDAGIAIPTDKEGRNDKKKKIKLPDEYVCTDCGTLDSPEWRKGPTGPKTLCNACGLRWAKKEKKKTPSSGGPGASNGGSTA